jgi:hypothetical protein
MKSGTVLLITEATATDRLLAHETNTKATPC